MIAKVFKEYAISIAVFGFVLGVAVGILALICSDLILFILMWVFLIIGSIGWVFTNKNARSTPERN